MKIKEWGIQAEIREMRGEGHRRIRYILNVQYADFSVSFQKNYIFNGLWQWIFKKACYNIFLFCVSLNFLRISRKFHTNFNFDERAALYLLYGATVHPIWQNPPHLNVDTILVGQLVVLFDLTAQGSVRVLALSISLAFSLSPLHIYTLLFGHVAKLYICSDLT